MTVIRVPAVNPRYTVRRVEADAVILLSAFDKTALQGNVYVDILAAADGTRTTDEILASLQPLHGGLALMLGMERLVAGQYLCEAEDIVPDAGFWSSLGLAPAQLREARAAKGVAVTAAGSADPEPILAALHSLHVPVVPAGSDALTVVVAEDYADPALEIVHRSRLDDRRPMMLITFDGMGVWIGPMLIPGETACWRCLQHRLQGNRPVERFIASSGDGSPAGPKIHASPLPAVAANLAALRIARRLWQPEEVPAGEIVVLDLASLETTRHAVVKRPQCPDCGTGHTSHAGKPLTLQPQRKLHTSDGGFRTAFPEETADRLERHVSPITGVVRKLVPYDMESPLLNVYHADHRLFDAAHDLGSLRSSLANTTAGKGRTASQARASALCEAVERYCGIFDGSEPRIRASYAELSERAIHPSRYLHFSPRQYRHRESWNEAHGGFAWIPQPFDDDQPIEWTPAWSLGSEEFRYFPTAYCYYNYRLEPGHVFCSADSNGNASGNTLEEAILQGFLELVERDAVALWWYNRLSRPRLDLESFDDPFVMATLAEYGQRNREVWALDLTSDLGIPSFAVISRRMDAREEIIQGYGSHLDPRIALSRALTECTQMLAHLNNGSDSGVTDPDIEAWYESATVAREPYLRPSAATRRLEDFAYEPSGDLRDDVLSCVRAASAAGLDTFVLDQTRPDIGFPVAKVIVPGLRHFWARFAPGRLYDTPVAQGWLPHALREEDMNPLPICS